MRAAEKAEKEKARKEKARDLATARADRAAENLGKMKARMELAERKAAEAKEAALALSEEGAGDASNKKGEGEGRQIGKEKRGKKVKAVTNAGVVTARSGAGKGETKMA